MTILRKIDLAFQTILILMGLAYLVIKGFLSPEFLFVQLTVGCMQMTGSLLSLLVPGPLFRAKLYHFIVALCYLVSLAFIHPFDFKSLQILYLLLPSWSLALYYYYISWLRPRSYNAKGRFLPHLSF
jgi:hypothetical protein